MRGCSDRVRAGYRGSSCGWPAFPGKHADAGAKRFPAASWLALGAFLLVPISATGAGPFEGKLDVRGQVRDGELSSRAEAPVNLYGSLAADRFHHDLAGETYFRAERDWSRAETTTDFYLGLAQAAVRGWQFSLGRQALEVAGAGFLVADAGQISFDPGRGWALSVFGGQPRYFEPQARSATLSRDEQFFGASGRYRLARAGVLGVSFVQLEREGHRLRQLWQALWRQQFPRIPARPELYSLAAYDAGEQNLERMNLGGLFLLHPRLFGRLEGSYYKPEQRSPEALSGLDRYSDPIFSLFSVSSLQQVCGGLQYFYRRNWSVSVDFSTQRYEPTAKRTETSHRTTAGFLWLPGGDGLEVVRMEYGWVESPGGRAHQVRLYHENRLYERLIVRTKLEFAAFAKVTNREDTAASGRLGVGYVVRPGLLAEVSLEANHNPRFDREFRAGLFLTYRWRLEPKTGWMDVPLGPERLAGGWAG